MTWLVNGKEFQNVTELQPAKRYEYFIKRVADWEELWGLCRNDRWAMVTIPEGTDLMVVWPHRIYAEALAHNQWLGYEAKVISLDDWMENWLPGLIRSGESVAVFPVAGGQVSKVEARQLQEDLEEELEKM